MSPELARSAPPEVLDRLRRLCDERGLDDLAENLDRLMVLVGDDLDSIGRSLGEVARSGNVVERAGTYLLGLGGKRLRPLCVALAARVGTGFDHRALELATAVELVHNATLLHDDVIDLAEARRGALAARAEFGNAASIFAGDWLLIEALRRVQRAALPGVLDLLLQTIAEMIRAEALQLEHRGRIDTSSELYFEVALGKSATLFAWAMHAGGVAGGVDPDDCAALRSFGVHLGLAFQVVDDLLDLTGGPGGTGKARFNDLREGKMTFPVIVALERDPSLRPVLEAVLGAEPTAPPSQDDLERIRQAVMDTRSHLECRELAGERVGRAIASLARLPASEATAALAMVARSTVSRDG